MPTWTGIAGALIAPGLAQVPTAEISGLITDASGAVVPGVEIRITHIDTQTLREGLSNSSG
ncbi:MAG: carboxypeptidase-like regulatory domain-containing protein, partial [Acidobacteriota bacterium]|nr:carboxypeptidase-like regulatory domain-containing protein [Acidobacteriota bacterium]